MGILERHVESSDHLLVFVGIAYKISFFEMNKDGCKYFQNAFLGYEGYLKMATSYMSSKNMKFAVLYEDFKGILSDKIGLSQPSFSLQCIFKGF